MTKFNSVIAIAAVALLSGPALAASLQPAAGEAPLFVRAEPVASTMKHQRVQADAAQHMPAAGEMSAQAAPSPASSLTRAQVRETLRQATAHGFHVGAGELS
jgi:hypothetical protein